MGTLAADRDAGAAAMTLPKELGPYAVLGVLGQGGGGIVYEGQDPEDGATVAVKVPHDDRELTTVERRRYLSEALMMARIDHPGVVQIRDAGILDDGRPFLVMERLVGETLADWVENRERFPWQEALPLFEQLSEAVEALHREGLIHRDLKPENVFVLEGGARLKLLDLGIAKDRYASDRTTTGMVRGTPATMAPERFFGAPASERSDVYELAVVFYVMLVGALPWGGAATDVEARLRPVAPRERGVRLPHGMSEVLMSALTNRPEGRPESARALYTQILRASEELEEAAAARPRAGATVTADHWPMRHPTPLDAVVSSRATRPSRRTRFGRELAFGGLALAFLGATVLSLGGERSLQKLAPGLSALELVAPLEAASPGANGAAAEKQPSPNEEASHSSDEAEGAVEEAIEEPAADDARPRALRPIAGRPPTRPVPEAHPADDARATSPVISGGVFPESPY